MCYSSKCTILTGTIETFKTALRNEKLIEFINYINRKTSLKGYTALHYAAYKRTLEEIKLLIEIGADKDMINNEGFNVLHMACQGKNFPALVYFVETFKMDINKKDFKGNTPLHWAALSNFQEGVEYLLLQGADINVKNNKELTVLHTALLVEKTTLVEILISKGAEYKNYRDHHDRNCIDYAKAMRNKEFDNIINKYQAKFLKIMQNFLLISLYFIMFAVILICLLPCKNRIYYYIKILDINSIAISIFHFIITGIMIIWFSVMLAINSYITKEEDSDSKNFLSSIEKINESKFDTLCIYCRIFKAKTMRHCFLCNRCINGYKRHSHLYGKCIGIHNIIPSIIAMSIMIISYVYFIIESILALNSTKKINKENKYFPFIIEKAFWLYKEKLKTTSCYLIIGVCSILIIITTISLIKELKFTNYNLIGNNNRINRRNLVSLKNYSIEKESQFERETLLSG